MVTSVDKFDTAVQFREMYEPSSIKLTLLIEPVLDAI